MALATDHLRVPGKSEGAIASMDMIAARDATSWTLAGLGKWHGGGGGLHRPLGRRQWESQRVGIFDQCFRALM